MQNHELFFGMDDGQEQLNGTLFKNRREDLLSALREELGQEEGLVLILGNLEIETQQFTQESNFFYLTGITDPGLVLTIDLNSGKTTLYIPKCTTPREVWCTVAVCSDDESKRKFFVSDIVPLGEAVDGYGITHQEEQKSYRHLCADLETVVKKNQKIFLPLSERQRTPPAVTLLQARLFAWVSGLAGAVVDISSVLNVLRRCKDMHEIDMLYRAIDITNSAHEAVARVIAPDVIECEAQAAIEFVITASGTQRAFPSIVATGKNATVLHYTANNACMKRGELVVVDIGASYNGYSADLTRTYPVGGVFSKRQRELYNIVLEVQEHVAEAAAAGYFLNNSKYPEKSLHHLAVARFKKYKLDQFFTHGIGHFLGLETHDVGDRQEPLQNGDVFTIEPGLYLRDEGIGIRIEDNYWIAKDKAVCLSELLPKKAELVEEMMRLTEDDGGMESEEQA
jgi:Xaa-Pro aminopeptidase